MQAFTLIELVSVIVILGILSISVAVYFPSQQTFNVSSMTESLKRDIQYTQSLAMNLNATYTLNVSASGYSITPTPPGGAVTVNLPSGLVLSGTSLSFNKEGRPSNTSVATFTLTAGGESKSLTVAPETGYIDG